MFKQNIEIEKILLTCPNCGKTFFIYKPEHKSGYCSLCYFEYDEKPDTYGTTLL